MELTESVSSLAKPLVLVVEDEAALATMLRYNLEKQGFRVEEAADGQEALTRISETPPDLVLLDWMLPVMSGIEVCRQIRRRAQTRDLPVIMVTARTEDQDAVRGLNTGADDYINKPFRPRELLARIGAHLRKAKETRNDTAPEDGRLVFRDLVIDTVERRVTRDEQDVILTHTEFDLLAYLAQNAGKVLSRERILSSVWGYEHPIETRVIDVHVRNLRRKIEPDPAQPRYILAVPGIGYRFAAVKP